jgi:hypothetical protein
LYRDSETLYRSSNSTMQNALSLGSRRTVGEHHTLSTWPIRSIATTTLETARSSGRLLLTELARESISTTTRATLMVPILLENSMRISHPVYFLKPPRYGPARSCRNGRDHGLARACCQASTGPSSLNRSFRTGWQNDHLGVRRDAGVITRSGFSSDQSGGFVWHFAMRHHCIAKRHGVSSRYAKLM